MKGWCSTAKTYMRCSSHKEDGWEDIDHRGVTLSRLDNERRALGKVLCCCCFYGLNWTPSSQLCLTEIDRKKRSTYRREVASFLKWKAFLQCNGKGLVFLGCEKKVMLQKEKFAICVEAGQSSVVFYRGQLSLQTLTVSWKHLKGRVFTVTCWDLSLLQGY